MNKISRITLSVGAYVAFIVLVNLLFTPEHLIEGVTQWSTNTWMGTLYLANVIVGFVFVLRDYAQREIGHKVLIATALAGIPVWYFCGAWIGRCKHDCFYLVRNDRLGGLHVYQAPAAKPDYLVFTVCGSSRYISVSTFGGIFNPRCICDGSDLESHWRCHCLVYS